MIEQRKLAAILFTDIQEFSSLLRQQEETLLQFLQTVYYPLADQLILSFQGQLIRREGDSIVAEFPTAKQAVCYAEIFQKDLIAYRRKYPEPSLKIRIGIHLGEVLHQQGEVLGHTLSVAKRLESFCQVDGICISQEVFQHLHPEDLSLHFQDLGWCALKGVGQVHIFQAFLHPIENHFSQTLYPLLVHELQNQSLLLVLGPSLAENDGEKKLITLLSPNSQDIHEAAQIYEDEHSRDSLKETLVQFFRKQLLQPVDQKILQLPLDLVLTTTLGGPLQDQLEQRQFFQGRSENQQYFSFFGSVKRDSFSITEDDLDQVMASFSHLPVELQEALATRTLVFVGCAPESRGFKNLYRRLSDLILFSPGKKRFLLWEKPSSAERWWKSKGVDILSISSDTFFQELQQRLHPDQTPETFATITALTTKRPYKFLDYFEMEDHSIFFGREEDLPKILASIHAQNLMTLYAKSGSGKTSLINAGLRPILEKEGYFTCYIRVFEDPIYAIKHVVNLQLEFPVENPEDLMLSAFLRNASKQARKPIVLFLDQFEEFFIRLGKATQSHFMNELERCLKKGESQTRFIFSLREDFLPEMELFRTQVPGIFYQSYRLKGLQREQAKRAIIEPAKLYGIEWEAELVRQLLQDLDEGSIEPPHLQIVCDRLYDKREGKKISLTQYRHNGGAKKLLAEYMTSVLESMEVSERKIAELLLKSMVTSLQTKSLLAIEEILRHFDPETQAQAKIILQQLIQQRLLRSFEHEGKAYCELAHDFLAIQIRTWLDEEEFKAKEVTDILRQELNNWNNFRWLPDLHKLEVFHLQKENPHLKWTPAELELILRSSLKHRKFLDYWWDRVLKKNLYTWDQLLSFSLPEQNESILYALEVAHQLGTSEARNYILQQLNHSEVCVREKGIDLLTLLKESSALEKILPLLQDPYLSIRWRVLRYLRTLENPNTKKTLQSYHPENMMRIPEGPFWMGSEVNPEEGPKRLVTLPAYYIDRDPVQNKEYQLFVQATRRATPKNWKEGTFPEGEAEHPVVHVSFHDAKAYAEWAGKRLPTEAEWEKAARGTDGRKYPWGEDLDSSRLNCLESGLGKTVPVGSYSPQGDSPYGVKDMAGQVWEWTSCWFDAYEGSTYASQYYGKQVIAIRGGSWSSQISLCRTSYRGMGHQDYPFAHGGFRCVMDSVL
ncbi:MAG: SUMF1/EgtB/PvdO family nonheme iron enzyme [Planctomycetota bacterium]